MAIANNTTLQNKRKFELSRYYEKHTGKKIEVKPIKSVSKDKFQSFFELCDAVFNYFQKEWNAEDKNSVNYQQILERQRKAIIGVEAEVKFFKNKIEEYIKANNLQDHWKPDWYSSLEDAIFQENWGLAGISEWVEGRTKELQESSSAKIIGNNIYFLIKGKSVLQPQKISDERREQLRRALRLNTPAKRAEPYEELYMNNGIRVAVYADDITASNQDVIVFRKYIIPKITFQEQADRGTIPHDAIDFFNSMVDVGYNIVIAGPVRTAKTTLLQTFMLRENPELEGLLIQTDPEIKIHELMPNAPIMNLIVEKEKLKSIIKSILRSDADYYVFAEARDGLSLYIALDLSSRGQNRMKMTYHINHRKIKNICYDIARRIVDEVGGSIYGTILDVAQSFHYVIEMTQLKDKSKKRLAGIYEIRFNENKGLVEIHTICKYIPKTDSWTWNYVMGEDKESIGIFEDVALQTFKNNLQMLADKYPMAEKDKLTVFDYSYLKEGR